MSDNIRSADDAMVALRDRLARRYRAPQGVLLTVAVGPDKGRGEEAFFTGKAVFLDTEVESRRKLEYRGLSLLEEWVSPIDVAIEHVGKLLHGGGAVAGKAAPTGFEYWSVERWGESFQYTGWLEWVLEASQTHGGRRASPPSRPIVGFGMPPFSSGSHALAEWVWGLRKHGSDTPHLGEMLVVVPDTRGRISTADWTHENMARVELEMNIPPDEFELQVLFDGGSADRHRLIRAPDKQLDIEVPKGTESISFYLVNAAGERLSQAGLSAWNRKLDVRIEKPPLEQQAESDLAGGENDEVEFKPFIEPKHLKERELVETVVAFANARGGRLYMGLDDHRGVQGSSELKRMYKGAEETARETLVKYIRKLIGDKIRPVPKFSVAFIEYRGEPVAVVSVERGAQPPYATDTDEVYVRKGSSNVRPDPLTELRELCERRSAGESYFVSGVGTSQLFGRHLR
ncbi:MAG TPA: ATP-binding protein [Archangium sp.]|nr:ATP-binding protein [Archangium sp.]